MKSSTFPKQQSGNVWYVAIAFHTLHNAYIRALVPTRLTRPLTFMM